MVNEILAEIKTKMDRCIDALGNELAKLRTGRAQPGLIDSLKVDYYGNPTPLNQVASIVVTDSRTLTVTPFEKTMVGAVEKVIMTSDLGLNPVTAGQVIRVPLPPLTEERRRDLVKQVGVEVENCKIAIRNVRRDANNRLKKSLKVKEISEDEERRAQDEVQKVTDKFVQKVESIAKTKETDLMQI